MFDIFCAYIFLAGGIVANKYILASMSPELFVALRMMISGTVLMIYNRHQVERLTYERVKEDRVALFTIAACTNFIPSILKAWSLKHMPASKQSLLGSIDPFVTALMTYSMFNEKIKFAQIIGMIIGFMGTSIVVFSKSSSEVGYEWLLNISYPELAIMTAVIMGRYGWILVQTRLRTRHYTPIQINALVQLIAGILAFFVALYTNQLKIYDISSYPHFIAACLFTIVGGNIIGYTLYASSLKNHSATLVSLAGFSIPLLVAFFAALFLGEKITLPLIFGGGFIFIGLTIFYIGDGYYKKSFKNH